MGGALVVSAVGQADDTALLSNDIQKLRLLLQLTLEYCQKYNVKLSSSKTKLLVVQPARNPVFVHNNPISIDGVQVEFTNQAEHVGILRSTSGNLPNILQRISSFKKALGAVTSCGLAKGRRSNPAALIRILTIYGTPVLMSGLASQVLSPKEVTIIDQQFKRTLQNILKLAVNSPCPLVYFVAGSLPATAILHLKQISLFLMICRLHGDPLNLHAQQVLLTSPSTGHSWFIQLRNLLLMYQLPHPLQLLANPPQKEPFKKLVKAKVTDHWEVRLRAEAAYLPSLEFFQPQFHSLTSTHPLWSSAGCKPYEVSKARIQLLFLSSQYPCAKYTRHWSHDNPLGICSNPTCKENEIVESPEHLLLHCPAYTATRQSMYSLCFKLTNKVSLSIIAGILFKTRYSNKQLMQLLLDCSVLPEIIKAAQTHGDRVYSDIFFFGRSWCFSIHRERMKRLGKWNFR